MSLSAQRNARRLAEFREAVHEHDLNTDDVELLNVLGNRPGFTLNTTNHLVGRTSTARRLRAKGLIVSGGLGAMLTHLGLKVVRIVCAVSAEERKGTT